MLFPDEGIRAALRSTLVETYIDDGGPVGTAACRWSPENKANTAETGHAVVSAGGCRRVQAGAAVRASAAVTDLANFHRSKQRVQPAGRSTNCSGLPSYLANAWQSLAIPGTPTLQNSEQHTAALWPRYVRRSANPFACQATICGLSITGALSDERTGLQFRVAIVLRQSGLSWVRVPRDS
jgi:hypothetical protein